MRTNRRQFMGLSFVTGLSVAFQGALANAAAPATTTDKPFRSLPAFLDTIIPADESQSATAIGIDRMLIEKAAASKLYHGVLRLGCRWIDREAVKAGGADFSALTPARQEEIVARAESSASGTLARVFFDLVRKDSFDFYYADARIWPSLGYDGPPQPAGFAAHAAPPGQIRQ